MHERSNAFIGVGLLSFFKGSLSSKLFYLLSLVGISGALKCAVSITLRPFFFNGLLVQSEKEIRPYALLHRHVSQTGRSYQEECTLVPRNLLTIGNFSNFPKWNENGRANT